MLDAVAVLAESSNGFDLLRIIASDSQGLSKADRVSIKEAADELEEAQRRLVKLYIEYCELQQHFIAVNDQLIAARKELIAKRKEPLIVGNFSWLPVTYYGGAT